MKKITKIFSLIVSISILHTNVYASEVSAKNLGGITKYVAMGIAVAIMAGIVYLAYRSDKKEENNDEEERSENDFPYEEESVMESNDLFKESEISTSNLMEDIEYEEESLFNSADNYIENKEDDSIIDEEDTNFDNSAQEPVTNNIETEEFYFETKPENNEDNEEIKFDDNQVEEVSFDIKEDLLNEEPIINMPIINSDIEEKEELDNEVDNLIEKKRFTRKKDIIKTEVNILENTFEEDFGEELGSFDIENEFEYEEDDDDDTPTFDELLKKSEEEIEENIETFDFMAEMEENLKKDQAKRLQKNTSKKSATKKNEVVDKKSTSKTKGTTQKKLTSKSKESSSKKTTKKSKEE